MARGEQTALTSITELLRERKGLSYEIGQRKARGEPVGDLIEQSRALSAQIAERSEQQRAPIGEVPRNAERWTTEVLTTSAQVSALRDEWRNLLVGSQVDSPFLTWEWMVSWYETYEDEGAVRCLAVRDGEGRLIGLAPLFLSERQHPKLGRRQIGFASTYGPSWGFYLELISTSGAQGGVAQATTEYLHSIRNEWDCAKFLRMPAEASSMWPLIRSMASMGWQTAVRPGGQCAVLPLLGDPQEVVATLASRKLRKNCRLALRRLARDYPRYAFGVCASAADLTEGLEQLMSLSIERHSGRSRPSSFLQPKYRLCFTRSMQRFWEAGWVQLATLEINGNIVALQPFLVYRQKVYLLSSAWAAEYGQYDVSHLLFVEAMRLGIEAGARQADFLSADMQYKFQYTRQCRQLLDVTSWPNRLQMARTLFHELRERAWDRAARVLRRSN